MTSKRQFLDPIGAGCRLILLYFSEPKTKIRIVDHAIELVPSTWAESLVWRKLVYKDSRDDLHVLYPMIVRFIELYLIERKNRTKSSTPMLCPSTPSVLLQLPTLTDSLFDQTDVPYTKPPIIKDTKIESDGYSKTCYECLKKLAEYIIRGLTSLEKTYGYDNATFTCKYYSNLLRAGINETYNVDMLPNDLKDLTAQNLLDVSKIKNLWNDSDIITLLGFFEKCFEAHHNKDNKAIDGNKAAIIALLNRADEEFRKIVNSTDSA
jgi:hypothetical protein